MTRRVCELLIRWRRRSCRTTFAATGCANGAPSSPTPARAHANWAGRTPIACVWRTFGAFVHAAWLRWDRWRIEMIWQDFKYALRALKAKPGFTFVTLVTLAIGIGGTTAIFGAVNAVLLRPLPYPDPDALVRRLQDDAQAAGSRRRHGVAAGLHRLAARQHGLHRGRRLRQRLVGADRTGRG